MSELRYNTKKTVAGSRINQLDTQIRSTKEQLANTETKADNMYKGTADHRRHHTEAYQLDTEKNTVEQTLERDLKYRVRNDPAMLRAEMEMRVATDEAATEKGQIDRIHENLRSGRNHASDDTRSIQHLIDRARDTAVETAVTSLAVESAKRIQKETIENIIAPTETYVVTPRGTIVDGVPLEADIMGTRIVETPEAIMAAGVDAERGVKRVQAVSKQAQDKQQSDEALAESILIESTTDTVGKIRTAKSTLQSIIATDDAVGAKASFKLLTTTGAPGRKGLGVSIEMIPAGDTSESTEALKGDALAAGIKAKDVSIDKWATDGERRSLAEIRRDPNTYSELTAEEFSTQDFHVLTIAEGVPGAISAADALAVLENPQTNKNLDGNKRALFRRIAGL